MPRKQKTLNLSLTFIGTFNEQHVYGYVKGGGVIKKFFHTLFRQMTESVNNKTLKHPFSLVVVALLKLWYGLPYLL